MLLDYLTIPPQRSDAYVYNITWITPRQPKDNCVNCSSPLTLDDCSHRFILTGGNIADRFKMIYEASKRTEEHLRERK